ncbi:MAG TPA: ACT domain-containing protein [Limnochordia bacterium]
MTDAPPRQLILTLSCPDRRGIVARTASLIAERGGNILDSQQFGDPVAATFFMRIAFADEVASGLNAWRDSLCAS